MQQYYSHFSTWEDYQKGLYSSSCKDFADLERGSVTVLRSRGVFKDCAERMLLEWVEAAKNNLTNLSQNRLAWVGQATCCHNHGAPDFVTKSAWWKLTEEQQFVANSVAQSVIDAWILRYESDSEVLCLKLD